MAVLPLSGDDYAKFEKTDPQTFMGMRLAWADAIVDLDGQKAAGKTIDRDAIKAAFEKAALNEPYLKAAGTQEIVKRYFVDVMDTSLMTKGASAVMDTYNKVSGKVTANQLDNLRNNKAGMMDLYSLGTSYNKDVMQGLAIDTMTKDFTSRMRDSLTGITKDITVTPKPMTELQISALADMESRFRTADALDDRLSKMGMGNPAVSQWLASVDHKQETLNGKTIPIAERLSNGTSKDVNADAKELVKQTTGQDLSKAVTPEQSQTIGQQVLNNISGARSEADKTGGDKKLKELIEGKDKQASSGKGHDEHLAALAKNAPPLNAHEGIGHTPKDVEAAKQHLAASRNPGGRAGGVA